MKKVIALMLVVVFALTLSACGNKETASDAGTSAPTTSETFVKPENYESVLLVSINPQFKLYLDENNKVLAVEAVNDDAKSFSKIIDFEDKTVETVVGNIVEKANEKGFIKENVTVDFEIIEQKDGVDNSDVLTKVVSAANQKATELKIEIKTEIKESNKSQTTETNSENTQTNENSKPTTSKASESKSTHEHKFSAATCTAPQKCSCGATEGKALGHKWQDATCKASKTCSVCKKTEGNIGSHKYIDGYCTYCNEMLTIKPNVGFKENSDYYDFYKSNDGTYNLEIWNFSNSQCSIRAVYTTDKEYGDINDYIVYKGITLYGVGFGGPMPGYTVTENEIIIKYTDEDIFEDFPEYASEEYKFVVNHNYDLVCVYSNSNWFKKGDVLDLVE